MECNLNIFKKNKPTDDDVIYSQKGLPFEAGDLLEIFLPNEKHFLVKLNQVNSNQQRGILNVANQLANQMGLPSAKTIKVRKFNPQAIELDVLDMVIKDLYLSRSDMYRFTNKMKSLAVFEGRKVEFFGLRGTVGELWCRGHRISAGYVGNETRVVYRSKSSVVHLFFQMSQEMWEFDHFGDNYLEKAINFISDLFKKWNEFSCGHDVTIVLFSRVFVNKFDKFFVSTTNLKKDYKGRYYEDFYSVVVQNERYMMSEWRKVIKTLRLRFNNYRDDLKQFMSQILNEEYVNFIEISSAEESNVLETLNMALNLYENYYIDRNFDRTGKICVVVTAGSSVFYVDRNHTHLTKQRICDLGIGIDLVCIGEQPLHAVPLFIFTNPEKSQSDPTDYYIPYWINHSFYRSLNEIQAIKSGKFIPRIKIEIETLDNVLSEAKYKSEDVFVSRNGGFDKIRLTPETEEVDVSMSSVSITEKEDTSVSTSPGLSSSITKTIRRMMQGTNLNTDSNRNKPVQSMFRMHNSVISIINPFVCSRLNIRTTTNSRRWSHVFPIDQTGKPIQQHHRLAIDFPKKLSGLQYRKKNSVQVWKDYYEMFYRDNPNFQFPDDRRISGHMANRLRESVPIEVGVTSDNLTSYSSSDLFREACVGTQRPQSQSLQSKSSNSKKPLSSSEESQHYMEGQKFNETPINHLGDIDPFRLIGVDWKSLTMPALLPITSDYYPDDQTLKNEFMENNYQLMCQNFEIIDVLNSVNSSARKPLTLEDVFSELIHLRLNQDFQMVTKSPIKKQSAEISKNLYRFCIGRMYHKIEKQQDMIVVNQYTQKNSDSVTDIEYSYCMKMPDSMEYMRFKTRFSLQKNFMWNFYDNYILTYGGSVESDTTNKYQLQSKDRFWRSRYLIVPTHPSTRYLMEKINADKEKTACDIYDEKNVVEQRGIQEEFFRFMEIVNRFKRRIQSNKPKFTSTTEPVHSTIVKTKSYGSNLVDVKKCGGILSACVVPLSNSQYQTSQYHQNFQQQSHYYTTYHYQNHAQNHSNSQQQVPNCRPTRHSVVSHDPVVVGATFQYNTTTSNNITNISNANCYSQNHTNSSSPATPIEKIPKQFTFDTADTSSSAFLDCTERLSTNSSSDKIVKALEDKESGLLFLPVPDNIKYPVFTSIACVQWCIAHVDGLNSVKDSIEFLNKLVQSKDFVSLSSILCTQLVYGFVLYMLNVKQERKSASVESLLTELFDKKTKSKKGIFEWAEVVLSNIEVEKKSENSFFSELKLKTSQECARICKDLSKIEFLLPNLPKRVLKNVLTTKNFESFTGKVPREDNMLLEKGTLYKKVVLDIENTEDSRTEWGVFQHQANYHPSMAFEFSLHWLVATGVKLLEKTNLWTRKMVNIQMIPVPCDPFALPSSINSDPLRGPIFVPLRLEYLLDPDICSEMPALEMIDKLFKDHLQKERKYRMMLMQELILKRFGFVRTNCVLYTTNEYDELLKSDDNADNLNEARRTEWSYIHCSGGMFAMIPDYPDLSTYTGESVSSDKSVANLVWDGGKWEQLGFLWSWNKMLPKKASTSNMVANEAFQDHMLENFRSFCYGRNDHRLRNLFREAKNFVNALRGC